MALAVPRFMSRVGGGSAFYATNVLINQRLMCHTLYEKDYSNSCLPNVAWPCVCIVFSLDNNIQL